MKQVTKEQLQKKITEMEERDTLSLKEEFTLKAFKLLLEKFNEEGR